MAEDAASGAAPVSPDEAERYLVRSRMEIGRILDAVRRQHEAVRVYLGDADDFLLSAIVGVDDDGLFLDLSPEPRLNRRLLERGRAVVVSFQDRVKVQFAVEAVEQVEYEGRPAFRVDLPGALTKLQRREAFRVQPAASAPLGCTLHGQGGSSFDMRVLDVSIGGLRLGGTPPDGEMEAGMSYERCVLVLPEVGLVEAALQVHYVLEMTLRDGRAARAWGCSFGQLGPGMETLLQRYVIKIDRERRARLSGA